MKTIWKVLGITALAAAVPVRIKKDNMTGRKKFQSLLLSLDIGPGENGEGADISIGDGIISGAITNLVDARKEANLFADDEPEAAVLDADDLQTIAEDVQVIAEETEESAGEAQSIVGEVQDAAGTGFVPES